MRYIIGIDLGTTNTCVAYVDTHNPRAPIHTFSIPQLIAPGLLEPKPLLPSFCCLPNKDELNNHIASLPWAKQRDYIVGSYALEYGSRIPTRLVASAKSWLCHASAARKDPILPPGGDPAARISPVEATSRYLRHIAEAWNWTIAKGNPEEEFQQQEIVLTVPASFDEIARALTAESAKKAGYTSITMLEEPQAAFYNWIDQHDGEWNRWLAAGDRVLVCDVGGGTTDFSYINVEQAGEKLAFQRMAVGDHLLLGGENIDNALAHHAAEKLPNEPSPTQWQQLCHQARQAKEAIYGSGEPSFRIILQGAGSKVVAGTQTVTIDRQQADDIVLKGFFGALPWEEARHKKASSGIKTLGLPYEDDPSIIKHLAQFLDKHGCVGDTSPTHILFNGGTMLPRQFQEAIVRSINLWFPQRELKQLKAPHFDHAVARGAAYYGKVRRGLGVRISGGSPRAFYLGISAIKQNEASLQALTLLPRGIDEGASYSPPQEFMATPNKPVSFQLYTSHVRLHDQPGDLITIEAGELHPLPPIHTILRYGKKSTDNASAIPVKLGISLSSIGTLELWLQSVQTQHRWELEFQLRSAAGQENTLQTVGSARKDETFSAAFLEEAISLIHTLFQPGAGALPKTVMDKIESAIGSPRREWSLSILRGLWPAVLEAAPQRGLSNEHAERWWNLAGFLLRPGAGYPMDDFRIKDLWKVLLGELKKPKSSEVAHQQLICLRRIAAGLSRGQQLQAASEIISQIFDNKGLTQGKPPHLYQERLRTLASMELIELATKIKLAHALTDKITKGQAHGAEYWALGKAAARQLLQGTLAHVIPPVNCAALIEKLLQNKHRLEPKYAETLFLQMARMTGHREIDLQEAVRLKIIEAYPHSEKLKEALTTVIPISQSERDEMFGETLPPGLQLTFAESVQ